MSKSSIWILLRTGLLTAILVLAVACAPAPAPTPAPAVTPATETATPPADVPDPDDADDMDDADVDDADIAAPDVDDADDADTDVSDIDATPGPEAMPGAMTAVSEELCEEIQNLLEMELGITFERTASAQIQDEEGFDFGDETGEGCLLIARGDAADFGEPGEIDGNFEQIMTDAGWHEDTSGRFDTIGETMSIYQLGPQLLFVTSGEDDDESVLRIFVVNQPAAVPDGTPAAAGTPDADDMPDADGTPEADEEDDNDMPETESTPEPDEEEEDD